MPHAHSALILYKVSKQITMATITLPIQHRQYRLHSVLKNATIDKNVKEHTMKKPTCLILTGIGVLLLVLVIVFVVPMFVNMFQEMGEIFDKHTVYKRTLRQYADEPVSGEKELLLSQLLKIAGDRTENIEVILSTEPYLAYINTQNGQTWTDYSTYIAVVPTQNHRNVVLSRLTELIEEEMEEAEQEVWIDFYYKIRDWSKTGKNQLNSKKEFDDILQNDLVNPLMQHGFAEGFTTKVLKMGMISVLMVDDSKLFHNAWQRRIQTYGTQEGYLRCAIATPDEFVLMRSFFEDAATFEKWISEPFEKDKEHEDQVEE